MKVKDEKDINVFGKVKDLLESSSNLNISNICSLEMMRVRRKNS